MDRKWMNKTLLALSIQMIIGVAYAAEEQQLGEYETTADYLFLRLYYKNK